MLPLDVQNTREGTDFQMYMMWYIVVMAALFYVTVALPFGLFYGETDEENEFVSSVLSSSSLVPPFQVLLSVNNSLSLSLTLSILTCFCFVLLLYRNCVSAQHSRI